MWLWRIPRLWKLYVEKKIVDNLVEKCSENTDESKIIHNVTLNGPKNECSCTVYIVLLVTASLIIIGISSEFFYFHWYLKKISLKQQFIKHIRASS